MLASDWVNGMPPKVWESLSVGLFTEQLELVLHRKRLTAVARHDLKLIPIEEPLHDGLYLFVCSRCPKRIFIVKSRVKEIILDRTADPLNYKYIVEKLGGCVTLSEVRPTRRIDVN